MSRFQCFATLYFNSLVSIGYFNCGLMFSASNSVVLLYRQWAINAVFYAFYYTAKLTPLTAFVFVYSLQNRDTAFARLSLLISILLEKI